MLICVAAPGTGLAQTIGGNAAPGQAGAYTLTVKSQLVVETVVAKDKQGKFIGGLSAKDFTVTEDEMCIRDRWELKLLSLEDLLAETHAPAPETPPLKPLAPALKLPATPQADIATAKPQQSAPAPPPAEDDSTEKPSDGLLINGSENNAATSPFTLCLLYTSPPITTVPRMRRETEPAPSAVHSGRQPKMKAKAVMTMGRKRRRAASSAESEMLSPRS